MLPSPRVAVIVLMSTVWMRPILLRPSVDPIYVIFEFEFSISCPKNSTDGAANLHLLSRSSCALAVLEDYPESTRGKIVCVNQNVVKEI